MKRDTKIAMGAVAAIPLFILSLATAATWRLAHGASERWRLLFRVMCHGLPERSLLLFGVTMPVCARCTGIYLGMLAGIAAFLLLPSISERAMRIAAFVAVTPLALDGLTQLAGLRESTNPLRIATGLLSGLAFGMWALCAVERRRDTSLTLS